MMVNMNGLCYRTWRNIQKAIEQFDVPMKVTGKLPVKTSGSIHSRTYSSDTRPPETWGRLTWRRC